MESKPLLTIGKPPTAEPFQPPPPPIGPTPQGPTVYDANFEFTTRLNALNLADKLLSMAKVETDVEREKRMRAHAYHLIDGMAAPNMPGV